MLLALLAILLGGVVFARGNGLILHVSLKDGAVTRKRFMLTSFGAYVAVSLIALMVS